MGSDLFPGFTQQYINTSQGVSIFVRTLIDQTKPPLLLLHGFPQTHVEFHKIVPYLRPHFSVVLTDLRGYGASSVVPSANGSAYSKRLMAQDCVQVMTALGFEKFSVVRHDRGARVAYRLAFDNPEILHKVVVIDIIPTSAMYGGFGDVNAGLRAYHWLFLAQPEPFPERMIQSVGNGRLFLEHTFATWTA
ncbi:Alpha/Beta hydrolase protein [Daldinia caldariorum]|uniref:Alpha/Beta hydrolase protein n=1 Tax=Daldinia caldariorum TaxID=326644 RepID=UPI0020077221|nr:Alpha/Beta hydrolase protein [Daldinia caldariorum]KAI1465552.1 Alpha/Beta hydrolase protein [Daldinia caldariorum]